MEPKAKYGFKFSRKVINTKGFYTIREAIRIEGSYATFASA